MLRGFRVAYAVLAWAFLIGVLVQVFFIGLGLLGDEPSGVSMHQSLGWILHLAPLLILLFAVLARAGSRNWQWALALAIVVFIVPILAVMRESAPIVAALHPVGAFVAFVIAVVVAMHSLAAVRLPTPAPGITTA